MSRIGHGFDRHRLAPGRRLRLGGVEVESEVGPVSHSDGDVLLHAVVNALLGAIGEGDIGLHFPDTDPRWRDVDSDRFVVEAMGFVRRAGCRVANVDTTVVLERPRLGRWRNAMRERIAALLEVAIDRVNVKFGSGETVGPVGRGEALEAHAVVLLEAAD